MQNRILYTVYTYLQFCILYKKIYNQKKYLKKNYFFFLWKTFLVSIFFKLEEVFNPESIWRFHFTFFLVLSQKDFEWFVLAQRASGAKSQFSQSQRLFSECITSDEEFLPFFTLRALPNQLCHTPRF